MHPRDRRVMRARKLVVIGALASLAIGALATWAIWPERPPAAPDEPPRDPLDVPPSPAPAMAELRVRTDPAGERIFVDGVDRGLAPIVIALRARRAHSVEARSEDGVVSHADVLLEPDEVRELAFASPPPSRGRLRVLSSPGGAIVQVDGEVLGVTPLEAPIATGHHHVRLRRQGYASAEGDVEVGSAAQQTTVSFALTPE